MSPDQLPVILSVQSKLLDSITTEQAYTIEKVFREGTSIREIAQNFLPRDEIGVASNTIRQLLIERIPEDEYTTLIQWKWPRTQIAQRIWIHGQTTSEKRQAGQAGAEKSWAKIYTDDELRRLRALVLDDGYKLGTRINAAKIAGVLNQEFHSGENVRASENVRQQVSRIKKKTKTQTSDLL